MSAIMKEESLQLYTDHLLTMNLFTCVSCKNLLRIPVMLVENRGNMCRICYDESTPTTHPSCSNQVLDTILTTLKIPCKYQADGCDERIPYKELARHQETSCRYHRNPCLFAGCSWRGLSNTFKTHFEADHQDEVIKPSEEGDGGAELFEMVKLLNDDDEDATSSSTEVIRILNGRRNRYVLKSASPRNCLLYIVCTMREDDDNNTSNQCTITHSGESPNKKHPVAIQTQCQIQPYSELFNVLNENHPKAVRIDLAALKQITQAVDTINVTVRIKQHDDNINKDDTLLVNNKFLLNHVECPVCKNLMKPPIYQCQSGHSICNVCRPRVEKCPTCRGLYGHTRNFSLEAVTTGVRYPCMYYHLGCVKNLACAEIKRHENACSYRPYTCPLNACNFTGNYATVAGHLRSEHPTKLITTNYYKTTVGFHMDCLMDFYNCERFYMIVYGNIFRLSFTRNAEYRFWAVEVLGHCDENVTFVYEIGIVDIRKESRKLIRTDLCLKEINVEDLFKKCIIFPNNILSSYSSNGSLTFYCQIHKN